MSIPVLVPWKGLTAPGLQPDVYDGDSTPPGELSEVRFYALPYARPRAAELVARMPRLQVLQTLNAGYDDLLAVLPDGATLCNGRGLHDASTAEHALGLILAAQRNLPQWVRNADAHVWDQRHTRSLADARVMVLGYGSIGAALESRLVACEATVVRVARTARPDEDVHGVDELPDLLPDIDVVVLVLPLSEATDRFFGAEQLGLLPDGALVVNVGRGRVLDTDALVAEAGRIRAALDVTDPEPPPADHPLWSLPGVIVTPHVGGGSATFYPRARRFLTDQLERFAAGTALRNVITGPEYVSRDAGT